MILSLTLLTACASSKQIGQTNLRPPDTLTCMSDPALPEPGPDGRPEADDTGAYIARLWQAWDDCSSKVGVFCRWAVRNDLAPDLDQCRKAPAQIKSSPSGS